GHGGGRPLPARHLARRGGGVRALPHLRHREALPRQRDRRAGRGRPGGGGGRPRGRGLRGPPHPPPPVAAVTLRAAVLSTGDELTSEVVAEVVGVPLVEDAEQAARIRQLFAALGREMPANNLKQALLPRGAIVIPNALGTAPGYRLAHGAKPLVVLPGVPREMK